MTGRPHRPSSTDGHLLLSLLISNVLRPSTSTGLPAEDARRSRSPLSGYATARTVRRLEIL